MNIMNANLGISGKGALFIGGCLAIAGLFLLFVVKAPKSTAVTEGSATTGVTTQVVAGATVGRKVTFSVSPRLGDGTNR